MKTAARQKETHNINSPHMQTQLQKRQDKNPNTPKEKQAEMGTIYRIIYKWRVSDDWGSTFSIIKDMQITTTNEAAFFTHFNQ